MHWALIGIHLRHNGKKALNIFKPSYRNTNTALLLLDTDHPMGTSLGHGLVTSASNRETGCQRNKKDGSMLLVLCGIH